MFALAVPGASRCEGGHAVCGGQLGAATDQPSALAAAAMRSS